MMGDPEIWQSVVNPRNGAHLQEGMLGAGRGTASSDEDDEYHDEDEDQDQDLSNMDDSDEEYRDAYAPVYHRMFGMAGDDAGEAEKEEEEQNG